MSKYQIVDDYDPSADDSPVDDEIIPKKRRGKGRDWIREKTFESKDEALNALALELCWSKNQLKKTMDGEKTFYRCNQTPWRSEHPECPCRVYLLFHADSVKVTLFRTGTAHENHLAVTTKGIPDVIKKIIKKLVDDGVRTPKTILSAMKRQNRPLPEKARISVPNRSQIASYLAKMRRDKYGPSTISVAELNKFCSLRKEVPDDMDMPFVVSAHISAEFDDDEPDLKIFFSTKRLLSLAGISDNIHCDATYKLIWQGYPVFVVGATDQNRSFHPFGLAVCYGETAEDFEFIFSSIRHGVEKISGQTYRPKILIADAAEAITQGFASVFGEDFTGVMCWFHVTKNIQSHLQKCTKTDRDALLRDINLLQLCQSDAEFDRAATLFLHKWRWDSQDSTGDFLEYFEAEWLVQHRFWYEGVSPAPSNCNSVEATNRYIKDHYTFRERLPMQQFLGLIEEKLLPDWSTERNPTDPNAKHFAISPSRTLAMWTNAFQWASSRFKLLSEKQDGVTLYYVGSTSYFDKDGPVNEGLVDEYKKELNLWSSFDDFRRLRGALWIITIPDQDWEMSRCNCPVFLKQYQCKHSLGIAIRLRLTKAPPEAWTIPLGQKRKRGRPSKPKASLVRQ